MNKSIDPLKDQAKNGAVAPNIEQENKVVPLPPRPKRSFGGLFLLIVLLLAIGGVTYWRLAVPQKELETVPVQAVQVHTATARLEDIAVNTVLTGKVRATDEINLFAGGGPVRQIHIEVGDYVEKGQRLLTLDTSQIQGGLAQAQAGRDIAQVGKEMAQESVDAAQQNLDRMQTLYNGAAIPYAQLEQAQNALTMAQNQLRQTQNQLRQAEAGVSTAASGLNLMNCDSPINGYVTEIGAGVKVGVTPLPTAPAIVIASLDDLEISVSVSEYLIGQLKEGDTVSYRIDSLGDAVYLGQVKSVALAPATGTITYPITVTVDEAADNIKPGMFAELSIPSQHKENVLVVPTTSLITRGGVTKVAVLKGELPYLKEVTTGINNGEMVEITSGLNPGDTVITKGQHYIVEGEAVIRLSE